MMAMGADLGQRRSKSRSCAKKMLVLVEGASERKYFEYFRGRSSDLKIIPVEVKRSGLEQIIEECRYRIKEYRIEGVEDKAAAVFDVDCFTEEDIKSSIDKVPEHDVSLYVSNPSFEYWLILHFRDFNKYTTQKDMEDELSLLLGQKYAKSEGISGVITDEKINEAILRASKIISPDRAGPIICKKILPSTTVHLLVHEILSIADSKCLR